MSISASEDAGKAGSPSHIRLALTLPQGALKSDASQDHFAHNPPIDPVRAPAKRIVPQPELASDMQANATRRAARLASSSAMLDCNANMSNVYTLTGSALLDRLGSYHLDCMDSSQEFFALNSKTYALYGEANIQAVAQAIVTRTTKYSPSNGQSIRQFFTFLRAGAYVSFYSNGALKYGVQTIANITDALSAFSQNPYFLDLSKEHGNVIYDYVSVAGSFDETRTLFAPKVLAYLGAMIANTGNSNYGLYSAQNGIYYFLFRGLANNDNAFIAYMNGQPLSLVDLLKNAAIYYKRSLIDDGGYYSDSAYNAVIGYVELLGYSNHKATAMDGLGAVLNAYPRLSRPWMAAVNNVSYYGGDCTRYSICKDQVKVEVLAKSFPNKFSLDDGKIVVRTSLPLSKAIRLYHAMKQVEAQYKRKTQESEPLTDDRNAVLNMYVYGSRGEYESFQPFLFNLNVENGGIYIEQDGTLYTYERATSESIYTLEELLRHEYVHYLNGRFTIEGLFGETAYSNGRLTWFEEGSAEFFAGSTQSDDVKPRKIMVSQIAADGASHLSVNEIFDSTYVSGFKFYRYAALFFNYLNDRRPATFVKLFKTFRQNDIAGFDALVAELRSDVQVQLEYSAYLDMQLAALAGMKDFAEGIAFDPSLFTVADAASVQQVVRKLLPDASCVKSFTLAVTRVGCSGMLASNSIDFTLDTVSRSLAASGPIDWQTFVCSYGKRDTATSRYYCEMTVRTEGTVAGGTASFAGYRGEYTVKPSSTGYTVAYNANPEIVIAVQGGETRLRFADAYLAFGQTGNAAKLYRLYRAAFNRQPDLAGIGFWIKSMDDGAMLYDVASSFVSSPEFLSLYGASLSDEAFIRLLYKNVLHRVPDSAGFNFWLNALALGTPRARVLAEFSESDENKSNVAAEIATGVAYIAFSRSGAQ